MGFDVKWCRVVSAAHSAHCSVRLKRDYTTQQASGKHTINRNFGISRWCIFRMKSIAGRWGDVGVSKEPMFNEASWTL